jgi:hypothetical protein
VATVTTPGLLDTYSYVLPAGVAVNAWVLPRSSETTGLGLIVTLVGSTSGAIVVALPLPQEGKRAQLIVKIQREVTEENFPIKSFTKE